MSKIRVLLLAALSVVAMSFADENLMEDKRDGKVYHKVNMGSAVWLAENLNFNSPHSYCYGNKASCDETGRLYSWDVAMSVCPDGWRLPTDEEWNAVLTAQGDWHGLENWGIKIPMAGDRRADGIYHYQGESAFFWSSTAAGKKIYRYKFDAGKEKHDRSLMVDGPAYTVKCVAGTKSCASPLMNAVRSGDTKKVAYLLESGASINEGCFTENPREMSSMGMDYEGISLLGMAIDRGNLKMARLLLLAGADPYSIDVSGPSDEQLSMMTRAMLKNNRDMIKLLFDFGGVPGFCDVALARSAKVDIIKMVAEKIDVEEMNQCWYGSSLVDLYHDMPAVKNLLIKRGGKSGSVVCPSGSNGEINESSNTRMCGD